MAGIAILAAIAVFVGFVYLNYGWVTTRQRRNKIIKDNNCKPARRYPHKDPFGFDFFFEEFNAYKKDRLLIKHAEDFEKYGNIFQVNQFGNPLIMSKEPAIVQATMATDFDSWGVAPVRYTAAHDLFGESFFIIDGHNWKHGRQQTRPALSKHEYGDLPRLERHVKQFLDLLPRDGSTINVAEPFHRLTSSFATEYFLGGETNILAKEGIPEEDKLRMDALGVSMLRVTTRSMKGVLAKILPLEKDFVQANRLIHAFVDDNIEKAIERNHEGEKKPLPNEKNHRVFLDDMVTQTRDRTVLRSAAITMYIGGTDTTSATLTGVCWALARAPHVVEKLRAEILEISPGPPTLETLHQMDYLKCVVRESMRLYGITTGFNYRAALKDTVLPIGGGPDGKSPLFVKKGTVLSMDYSEMHKDPRWWGEDAKEFKPERWQKSSPRDNWVYQGFGSGPRLCPGQNLAFTNTCYTVARLFQEFKGIESRDDRPWTANIKLAVESLYGAEVALIPA